jgi:hypothetical protein
MAEVTNQMPYDELLKLDQQTQQSLKIFRILFPS